MCARSCFVLTCACVCARYRYGCVHARKGCVRVKCLPSCECQLQTQTSRVESQGSRKALKLDFPFHLYRVRLQMCIWCVACVIPLVAARERALHVPSSSIDVSYVAVISNSSGVLTLSRAPSSHSPASSSPSLIRVSISTETRRG